MAKALQFELAGEEYQQSSRRNLVAARPNSIL